MPIVKLRPKCYLVEFKDTLCLLSSLLSDRNRPGFQRKAGVDVISGVGADSVANPALPAPSGVV